MKKTLIEKSHHFITQFIWVFGSINITLAQNERESIEKQILLKTIKATL